MEGVLRRLEDFEGEICQLYIIQKKFFEVGASENLNIHRDKG